MNDITCDVCRDLMPLVKDGIASADSRLAVERHLESCPSCRARFEKPLPAGGERPLPPCGTGYACLRRW